MTLAEFVNKYINTKVDYDKSFGAQCVDLFRQYCKDVLNIPHTEACATTGGARDLFLDYFKMPLEQKYFYAMKATEMKYGDVIIWDSTETNKYGHVAVLISKINNNSILVFEQNGIKQDGAKLVVRLIENILGILRFKEDVK